MRATNPTHSPDEVGAAAAPDELTLAGGLYEALTSGHDRLGYNVSGTYALWTRGAGGRGWKPAAGAPTVPRGEWRPCVEVLADGTTRARRFNPWVLREHVRGRYAVAPQAPSWTAWVAFDLDAHVAAEMLADGSDEVIPVAAVRRALAKRDAALAEIWRAFALGPGREPVLFETPGQGLHLYLPITRGAASPTEHTRPAGWLVEWVADRLQRAGVRLQPGRIELYPSGRPLRAPCGARMTLLRATRPEDADDLGLEPVVGTTTLRRVAGIDGAGLERVRKPWAMAAATLAQWAAARRPLEAWLGEPRAAWSVARGPFVRPEPFEKNACGDAAVERQSQDKDEVQGRPGGPTPERMARMGLRPVAVGQGGGAGSGSDPRSPSSPPEPSIAGTPTPQRFAGGVLRRGREFRAHLQQLLRHGVVTPGTRHDAVLTLVFGWHVQGKGEAEVRAELAAWSRAHAHVSKLQGERFVKQCLREGMHYYHRIKKLPQRARSLAATVGRMRALQPADRLMLAQVAPEVREEAWAILEYLHGHAAPSGDVLDTVMLGRAQLDALTVVDRRVRIDGRRCRAEVLAVRELERLGVLSLYVDYSRGRHGRVFCCWYVFGTGVLPAQRAPQGRHAARGEGRVLAERRVREGVVRVWSDGTRRAPWVELEPHAGVVVEAAGGGAWWREMYERRRFTVRDLRAADETNVIAGPWQPTPRTVATSAPGGRRDPGTPGSGGPVAPWRAAVVPVAPAPTRAIPAAAIAPPAAVASEGRAALAAELGAPVEQLADFDPELAALAAGALRAIERRG